ncbi:LytR C-terminal domain-containing protein [Streptomyces harbinensis]|uniref:LytR C-terminal domain-containing protein n=1 Tax=Streptomyces harbinensis TaxID=1176198 RepID=UPI0034E02901
MRPPRRRRRTVALALSTVAVLGLVGTGTLQLIRVFSAEAEGEGPQRAAASGARECATERPETEAEGASGPLAELPEPRTITVNVYNATTRTGLAQQTADALAERGFVIGTVDNAPEELDGKVEAPGLLLGRRRRRPGHPGGRPGHRRGLPAAHRPAGRGPRPRSPPEARPRDGGRRPGVLTGAPRGAGPADTGCPGGPAWRTAVAGGARRRARRARRPPGR